MEELKKKIREIPDFPKKGILFYDLTTLFRDRWAFATAVDLLTHRYIEKKVDAVLGIEARGFVLGSALAYRLNAGIILARKKGKLPWKTVGGRYELEYGSDMIEIHADAIKKGEKILVVDDLLATGGTGYTAASLVEKCGGKVVECAFLVELTGLNGREKLKKWKVFSLLQYEGE
jgi:adenine phosphoribosyltransferase